MIADNYTDLDLSQRLQVLADYFKSKGIEPEAWWVELLYTKIPRLVAKISNPDSVEHEFILDKDIEDSFSSYQLGMDNSGHYGINKKFPAYSVLQLWKALPEWFVGLVKHWLKHGSGRDNKLYALLDMNPNRKIDFKSTRAYFYELLDKHWGNWLRIYAEMLLYLHERGLL